MSGVRRLMPILGVLIGGYLFVCLFVFFFQGRLVYYPEKEIVATPGDIGLEYRDVFFETEDGVKYRGKPAQERRVQHGNSRGGRTIQPPPDDPRSRHRPIFACAADCGKR